MASFRSTCISWMLICFCIIVVFFGPFIILVTLSYVALEPRFYIQQLYIPALNDSSSSSHISINNSIFIDLKFKKVVAYLPLRYEDINITLFYGSNRSFSVGNRVVPGFYQGRKKTVIRKTVVEARGLPWEDAFRNISGGSTVALTVELATKYKLKRCHNDGDCSYSSPKAMVVAAHLQLNASGRKLSKKAIRLH